jgi:hypothetical protein
MREKCDVPTSLPCSPYSEFLGIILSLRTNHARLPRLEGGR